MLSRKTRQHRTSPCCQHGSTCHKISVALWLACRLPACKPAAKYGLVPKQGSFMGEESKTLRVEMLGTKGNSCFCSACPMLLHWGDKPLPREGCHRFLRQAAKNLSLIPSLLRQRQGHPVGRAAALLAPRFGGCESCLPSLVAYQPGGTIFKCTLQTPAGEWLVWLVQPIHRVFSAESDHLSSATGARKSLFAETACRFFL